MESTSEWLLLAVSRHLSELTHSSFLVVYDLVVLLQSASVTVSFETGGKQTESVEVKL